MNDKRELIVNAITGVVYIILIGVFSFTVNFVVSDIHSIAKSLVRIADQLTK